MKQKWNKETIGTSHNEIVGKVFLPQKAGQKYVILDVFCDF